jgi:hypothetical protein
MKMNLVQNVEPGTYHGSFEGVAITSHEEYGPGVRWNFRIDEGGALVSRTTKGEASPRNTCGKFWEMVSGLPLEDAITHDSDEWIGHTGEIVVENSPSGDGVRVAQFTKHPGQPSNNTDAPF